MKIFAHYQLEYNNKMVELWTELKNLWTLRIALDIYLI